MGRRIAFHVVKVNVRDQFAESTFQIGGYIRVGVLIDHQASRSVGTVDDADSLMYAGFLYGLADRPCNIPKLEFAAGGYGNLLFHAF